MSQLSQLPKADLNIGLSVCAHALSLSQYSNRAVTLSRFRLEMFAEESFGELQAKCQSVQLLC